MRPCLHTHAHSCSSGHHPPLQRRPGGAGSGSALSGSGSAFLGLRATAKQRPQPVPDPLPGSLHSEAPSRASDNADRPTPLSAASPASSQPASSVSNPRCHSLVNLPSSNPIAGPASQRTQPEAISTPFNGWEKRRRGVKSLNRVTQLVTGYQSRCELGVVRAA